MKNNKVLVADYVHQSLVSGLTDLGYHVVYAPDIQKHLVNATLQDFAGVIINTKTPMDSEALTNAENLKFIGRLGSGLDIIDLPLAEEKDIKVINSPEGNCNAVAEHAMGMLLALANNIIRGDREVRHFQWNREKNRGFELAGKTIGIVGYGHTGAAFASKFENWQTKLLIHDKYKEHYLNGHRFMHEVDLADVQKQCDVISFHLPLTEETREMVDANFLNKCKKGVIIVNTSRGKVVRELDLLAGLKSGQVGGACLDVFENEKTDTYTEEEKNKYAELYALENIILTPHVAGWTHESKEKIAKTLIEKISRLT